MTMNIQDTPGLGIRAASARTGLPVDTLRWYEREGLFPPIPRGPDGRRFYPERELTLIELVVSLRRTGLPVDRTREFVQSAREGAASHGRRMAMLEAQRTSMHEQRRQLERDLDMVEAKIAHYRDLIANGLDCEGLPVDAATAGMQRRIA